MNPAHSSRRRLFAALFLVCCTVASPAHALWSHDPNVNVLLSQPSGSVGASISDGAGGQFIAFTDTRNTINVGDIFVQHLSSSGQQLWTANGVQVAVNNQQKAIGGICTDGAGGVIVTWTDNRAGNADIYAQRINSAGVPQWTVNGVGVCTNAATANSCTIATDFTGGAYIAWTDSRAPASHIAMQHINASGAALWVADGISVTNIAGGFFPVIASVTNGGSSYVQVAWIDTRTSATTGNDIYSQAYTSGGTALYAPNGFAVCNATGNSNDLSMFIDLHYGSYFVWDDARGTQQTYVQRYQVLGSSPYYAPNGIPVAPTGTVQAYATAQPDGVGGMYVAFGEPRTPALGYDVFAQHLNAAGNLLWGTGGATLDSDLQAQFQPVISAVPGGGLDAVFIDQSIGSNLLRAQRLDVNGVAQWGPKGVLFGGDGAFGNVINGLLQHDADNGLVVAFTEAQSFRVAAHGIDRWGKLGAEPVLASVRDVPNDQGGQVRVSWQASALDTDPADYSVANYYVYRAMSAAPALAQARAGRAIVEAGSAEAGLDARAILRTHVGQAQYYWEQIGTQKATHLPAYSFVCATTSDSIAGSNPRTAFMIYAASNGTPFWTSQPDSGYSVDNLAPLAPAPFAAQYAAGTAVLHWKANTELDLAGYQLYRGTSPGFVTDAAHLVSAVNDTTYSDAAGAPAYYKLVAVDVHGNVSPAALAQPSGTLDAGAPATAAFAFAAPAPDPVATGARTTLRFTLPAAARVTLDVLDAQGRRVAQPLADRALAAGDHALAWAARDANGRALASGLYFVRLQSGAQQRVQRLVVLGGD